MFRRKLEVGYVKHRPQTMTDPPATLQRQRQKLIAEIAELGFVLPGSLTARYTRCSTPGCHCRSEQPPSLHGPYHSWTRKIAGKTVTRQLSAEQVERYGPWFEDARKLRALITQLESLSLQAAEHLNGWGRK
jgi:hypothetical protein